MARKHPITGMDLEDGSGALPDDMQAMVLHLPYIAKTRGEDVAADIRGKLLASIAPELPATLGEPVEEPKPDFAKLAEPFTVLHVGNASVEVQPVPLPDLVDHDAPRPPAPPQPGDA